MVTFSFVNGYFFFCYDIIPGGNMKLTISNSIILVFTITIGFGQSVSVDDANLQSVIDGLNEEQRLKYFRQKITIEPASGLFGKVTYRNWNAYQGLDKQLKTEDFFSLTGFEEEAPDFGLRTKLPWKFLAYTGITLGLVGITTVEEGETTYAYDDEGYYDEKTTDDEKPLLIPGIIFLGGGVYSLYYYITHPQLTTYELAREIASAYNNKLIDQLK